MLNFSGLGNIQRDPELQQELPIRLTRQPNLCKLTAVRCFGFIFCTFLLKSLRCKPAASPTTSVLAGCGLLLCWCRSTCHVP